MVTSRSGDVTAAAGVRPTQGPAEEGAETAATTQGVVRVADGGGEDAAGVVAAAATPVPPLQPPPGFPPASGDRERKGWG